MREDTSGRQPPLPSTTIPTLTFCGSFGSLEKVRLSKPLGGEGRRGRGSGEGDTHTHGSRDQARATSGYARSTSLTPSLLPRPLLRVSGRRREYNG